jgi:peptidyl-prolyl cis-trans isomerase A (cyclophilin A)
MPLPGPRARRRVDGAPHPCSARARVSPLRLLALFVPLAVAAAGAPARAERVAPAHVVLVTELGDIELEVDLARAPVTARNFLRYVEAGRYDGGRFHRTVRADNQPGDPVRIAVVQAGVAPAYAEEDFPPIPLERTSSTGLRHRDGTISMARAGPATATSDFFVCVGDQPALDEGGRRNRDGQGFAAFGRVARGMDVVRRIHAAPARGQTLAPPVAIRRAYVRPVADPPPTDTGRRGAPRRRGA